MEYNLNFFEFKRESGLIKYFFLFFDFFCVFFIFFYFFIHWYRAFFNIQFFNIINRQQSIEVDLANPTTYKKNSEENNDISLSFEKEYSIEGKIEQDGEKNKAYEKKQIGINIKKCFNKTKNNIEKKEQVTQGELMRIKNRINNKKQKDDKITINKTNKKNIINNINKTFNNKDVNFNNLFHQTDILYTDYMKKTVPFIKPGNSSARNNNLKVE